MADPRPCYAPGCSRAVAGLHDGRGVGGHVELACAKHRDTGLVPSRRQRCEGCTEVGAPLAILETPRGPRWLCRACEENPALGARVLELSFPEPPGPPPPPASPAPAPAKASTEPAQQSLFRGES